MLKYFKILLGLKLYQNIGIGLICGMYDFEGVCFIVLGCYLFWISNIGVGIFIGIIFGVGCVLMMYNQFKIGYQFFVENGQGGGGYVYDLIMQMFGCIIDFGYLGLIFLDYFDFYMFGVELQGWFWFYLNLVDVIDYNMFDCYEVEVLFDKIVGLVVSQFEVVVFGQWIIEFFYNVGMVIGMFQNCCQVIICGCVLCYSIVKLDNILFWLGDDGIVYWFNGYVVLLVFMGLMYCVFVGLNWVEVFVYVWEDCGFKVYYLIFFDGYIWVYDVVFGFWI